jgi:hypothetical protein
LRSLLATKSLRSTKRRLDVEAIGAEIAHRWIESVSSSKEPYRHLIFVDGMLACLRACVISAQPSFKHRIVTYLEIYGIMRRNADKRCDLNVMKWFKMQLTCTENMNTRRTSGKTSYYVPDWTCIISACLTLDLVILRYFCVASAMRIVVPSAHRSCLMLMGDTTPFGSFVVSRIPQSEQLHTLESSWTFAHHLSSTFALRIH